jgi:hypothetical protein
MPGLDAVEDKAKAIIHDFLEEHKAQLDVVYKKIMQTEIAPEDLDNLLVKIEDYICEMLPIDDKQLERFLGFYLQEHKLDEYVGEYLRQMKRGMTASSGAKLRRIAARIAL